MAAFLLWNVHRNPLDALVQALVRQHSIDIVLLVEFVLGGSQLPGLLLQDGLIRRAVPGRFGVFVRAAHRFRRLNYRLGNRVNIWRWQAPQGQDGLVALVHWYDRRNYEDGTRRHLFRRIEDQLRILTHVGGVSLLDARGLPDPQTGSDHLPIVFHWNL
jgi:hypothetical protein